MIITYDRIKPSTKIFHPFEHVKGNVWFSITRLDINNSQLVISESIPTDRVVWICYKLNPTLSAREYNHILKYAYDVLTNPDGNLVWIKEFIDSYN